MRKLNKIEFVKILGFLSIVDLLLNNSFVNLFFVFVFILGPLLPILLLVLYAQVPARVGRQLLLLVGDGAKSTLVLLDLFPSVEHVSVPVEGVF